MKLNYSERASLVGKIVDEGHGILLEIVWGKDLVILLCLAKTSGCETEHGGSIIYLSIIIVIIILFTYIGFVYTD